MKSFSVNRNVGKSKFVVNFHNGEKKHKDGSPFFDIKICKKQAEVNSFIAALKSEGYCHG